jgi:hypothetical protein
LGKPAAAKTVRLAVISSMEGDVTLKKGGGSQTYDAYESMSLNQGDTLYTGSDGSVTLDVSSGDSEITIGSNAEFNISDLAGQSGEKKSKFKVWAGSIWVKVKSLAGSNDEFEVETPTAVMGVRGTQFFVGVDSKTGKTKVAVGAGLVSADVFAPSTSEEIGSNEPVEAFIYPTQQMTVESRDETKDLTVNVEPLDIEGIVNDASANIIKAIIENKVAIDKENVEFIERIKNEIENGTIGNNANSTFVVKDINELNKVITNLNNLIGNIVKTALDTNKVEKAVIAKVIEDVNKSIGDPNKKLNLDDVKPFDPTAGTDPDAERQRKEALEKIEAEKLQKELEVNRRQDELKAALGDVLVALEKSRKALEEENKKALADTKSQAEADFLKKLDEAAKNKFNEDKAKNKGTTTFEGNINSNSGSSDGTSNKDTKAPNVTKLGDGAADYTIAAGGTAALIFSETLSDISKTAVVTALSKGADKTLNYSWNGADLTINGSASSATTFVDDVKADVSDVSGNMAKSLLLVDSLNAAPTATDVTISGTLTVGKIVYGSYIYSDSEGDTAGISTYQWYRATDKSGTNKSVISGATASAYTLTLSDAGKYIIFEVTPVATSGTTTGIAVIGTSESGVEVTNTASDTTAPTVTKLGNGMSDYTIVAGGTATMTFSEE